MASLNRVATKRRKDGKLVVKYRVGWREPMRDDYGVQRKGKYRNRSETFEDYAEAQAFKDELEAARHTGGTSALSDQRRAGELPLGYYAREWLSALDIQVANGRPKQSTADEYARLLRCYVLPELGEVSVASITPRRCEQFVSGLVRQRSRQGDRAPLSPGTVKHAYDVLRRVLKYAQRHGAIAVNPCDAIEFTGASSNGNRERFEHRPLSPGQVGALSAAVAGIPPADYIGPTLPAYPVYALMIKFMAYTGLRAAEVTGLEVADIVFAPSADPDAPSASVRVQRAKERKQVPGRKGTHWVTGPLKTKKSERTVPLPPWLAQRMADYLANVHERANEPSAPLWPSRKNGGGHRAEGQRYAVPLDWSQPLALGAFYDTIMKPALEAIGLPASRPATATRPAVRGVRVHDLRHTYAVLHLSAGVNFVLVSKRMGHATRTVTLDTYGDWIEQDDVAPIELPAPPVPASAGHGQNGAVVPLRRSHGQQTG
ncbi:tyrosine-type recombinase/integrase [Mycolicibacterium lacusdiani]|uniref:tyrosine-type recombinase/integrase n=1 Tax=Mycolicibacterium lacusdiani TaxID=2895283 RepID=UPI001F3C9C1C|nr:site-specific integrase [Mycolicibacterium lacusdiani]